MDKTEYMSQLRLSGGMGKGPGRGAGQKGRLLDDSDLNIGNAQTVFPQPLQAGGLANIRPEVNPPRLLNLDALSPTGQNVTIALMASVALVPGISPSQAGPITGILEFGNGGQFTRVEIDVPVGPYEYGTTPREPRDGGILVTVPSGALRVYARNDGGYITPNIGGDAAGLRPPNEGTGGVLVKAFAGYFTRPGPSRPRKTLYLGAGTIDAAYSIPPFAQKVRVLRDLQTNAATYTLYFSDSIFGNTIDVRTFAAATPSDFVDVPGTANLISVGGAGPVGEQVALEFEIGI